MTYSLAAEITITCIVGSLLTAALAVTMTSVIAPTAYSCSGVVVVMIQYRQLS